MDSIQAGYLSGVVQEDGRFGYGNDSYLMGKTAQSKAISAVRSQALTSDVRGESLDLPRQGTTLADTGERGIGQALTSSSRVVIHSGRGGKAQKDDMDPRPERNRSDSINSNGGRSDGSDGSKAMIIKTTKEWSISYQDA